MSGDPLGLLVMAYGGPDRLEDVEPYLRDVRGYRETPDRVVEEVRRRYEAIGGRSPILERTRAQATALAAALAREGRPVTVEVGMRHWHPYIADALARLVAAGVARVVGLVMAPHYSRMSIERYFEEIAEAGQPATVAPVREWHCRPGYVEAAADRVRSALGRFPDADRNGIPILFTAHSLPRRILEWGDPYPAQLEASVRAVMARLGDRPHRFAYQSAAMTKDPWLGPDAAGVLDALAAEGHTRVVVAPIGFTCEHVEVLYDVDIELRRQAEKLGVHLERIEMMDCHPAMIDDLARLVIETAAAEGWT